MTEHPIQSAWRALWPRTRWLRDAADTLVVWTYGAQLPVAEWNGTYLERGVETLHGFEFRFDTSKLNDAQYLRIVNWGVAAGYPMFAPALSENWRTQGPSFSAGFAHGDKGKPRRAYLWEHGKAMDCEPTYTHLVKGKAAQVMVDALVRTSEARAVALTQISKTA